MCSVANPNKGTGFCSRSKIRAIILKYGQGTLEGALKRAKVADEVALLRAPDFRQFAKEKGVDSGEIDAHVKEHFAPEGPSECCDLFANFNIQDALADLRKKYPWLYVHPCNMINFAEYGDSLSTVNANTYLNYKAMCCIVNTDVNTGRGRHWVCIFGDFRGSNRWTLEFFNSSGNGPGMIRDKINSRGDKGDIYGVLMDYLQKLAHELESLSGKRTDPIIVTDVRNPHQKSNTECGPYCVYYIHKRCDGVPYKYFRSNRVPDHIVTEFRSYVFRPREQ